jgi:hypothetical protein
MPGACVTSSTAGPIDLRRLKSTTAASPLSFSSACRPEVAFFSSARPPRVASSRRASRMPHPHPHPSLLRVAASGRDHSRCGDGRVRAPSAKQRRLLPAHLTRSRIHPDAAQALLAVTRASPRALRLMRRCTRFFMVGGRGQECRYDGDTRQTRGRSGRTRTSRTRADYNLRCDTHLQGCDTSTWRC